MRGDMKHPCVNNYDISMALHGNRNCNIYTKGTFEISDVNLIGARIRNIKLVGIDELRRKYDDNFMSRQKNYCKF